MTTYSFLSILSLLNLIALILLSSSTDPTSSMRSAGKTKNLNLHRRRRQVEKRSNDPAGDYRDSCLVDRIGPTHIFAYCLDDKGNRLQISYVYYRTCDFITNDNGVLRCVQFKITDNSPSATFYTSDIPGDESGDSVGVTFRTDSSEQFQILPGLQQKIRSVRLCSSRLFVYENLSNLLYKDTSFKDVPNKQPRECVDHKFSQDVTQKFQTFILVNAETVPT
eukprot:Awhi_evm1s798